MAESVPVLFTERTGRATNSVTVEHIETPKSYLCCHPGSVTMRPAFEDNMFAGTASSYPVCVLPDRLIPAIKPT